MKIRVTTTVLEEFYSRYNRREFIHPDPLEFLYRYKNVRDREVAGLVASSLAYGRVEQILGSVSFILDRLGSPVEFLKRTSLERFKRMFGDFKHRFTTGEELAWMLYGAARAIARHGSLEACFRAGLRGADETVLPALTVFVRELTDGLECPPVTLLPSPGKGSACKRLNLYLRWMVRSDDVDPGGWAGVSPSRLIVPLDTHMHRISLRLGFTRRKQADMAAALEVTRAFRKFSPCDPVRYDFALTRLGMRGDGEVAGFVKRCRTS